MATATLPAVIDHPPGDLQISGGVVAIRHAMETLKSVRTFVAHEMIETIDFGLIPGAGTKKVMFLAGAQKVAMYFNAYPDYEIQPCELGGGHVEYLVKTKLIQRSTGQVIGSGVGSCSSMEGKYRFRNASRVCPDCGKPAIIKGKEEYGGGWVCFKKKDGCGAKFEEDDPSILGQKTGHVENENIHDQRNTILKMAKKRSTVDASIALGCLSELFAQDLDDTFDMTKPAAPADAVPEPEKVDQKQAAKKPTRTWEQVLDRALDAWDKFEASESKREREVRRHRIAQGLVSDAIAAGYVVEDLVCVTNKKGERVKDSKKVFDCAAWLYHEEATDWTLKAIKAHLDRVQADLQPKPTAVAQAEVIGGAELLRVAELLSEKTGIDLAAWVKRWGGWNGMEGVPIAKWTEEEADEAWLACLEMLGKAGFDPKGDRIGRDPGQEG